MRMILDITVFLAVLASMVALYFFAGDRVFAILGAYVLVRLLMYVQSTKPRWQVEQQKKNASSPRA